MTSKEQSTKRFIDRTGSSISVLTTLEVVEGASVGAKVLKVSESVGILPSTKLTYGSNLLVVDTVAEGLISLKEPITGDIPSGALLESRTTTKGLFMSPGRDLTRDTTEMNRRLRVPSDVSLTYASILTHGLSRYFLTRYQEGDSSLSLGIKLINTTVDWYAKDPDFESESEEEGDLVTWDTKWPESPDIVPIQTGIPAYQEQISLYSNLEEPGYKPLLNRIYIIPKWVRIKAGDYVRSEGSMMRVLGIDYTRVRNMQALSVDYYRGVGLDGQS